MTWSTVGASTTAVADHGYATATSDATPITIRLPASAGLSVGSEVAVTNVGSGFFTVEPSGAQAIVRGSGVTPVPGGTATWDWDGGLSGVPTSMAVTSSGRTRLALTTDRVIGTSTDGATWTSLVDLAAIGCPNLGTAPVMASSWNGQRLVVAPSSAQSLQVLDSPFGGCSAVGAAPTGGFGSVASSWDGTWIAAIGYNVVGISYTSRVYIGSRAGPQVLSPPGLMLTAIGMAGNGSRAVAVTQYGEVMICTPRASPNSTCDDAWELAPDAPVPLHLSGAALSWDGLTVAVSSVSYTATTYDGIWISQDGGVSYTLRNAGRSFESVSVSADGQVLAAVEFVPGAGVDLRQVWTSVDGGETWVADLAEPTSWASPIAMSADGRTLAGVMVLEPAGDWNTLLSTAPDGTDSIVIRGTRGASVRLVYLGADQWAVIEATGALQALTHTAPY